MSNNKYDAYDSTEQRLIILYIQSKPPGSIRVAVGTALQ